MGWKPQWHISKSKILEPAKETGRKCKQRGDIGWEFHSPRAGSTQVTWRSPSWEKLAPQMKSVGMTRPKRFLGACLKRWKHPPNIESLISPCNVFSSALPKEIAQYEPESVCPAEPRGPDEMTFWRIFEHSVTHRHTEKGTAHSTGKPHRHAFFSFEAKKRREAKRKLTF